MAGCVAVARDSSIVFPSPPLFKSSARFYTLNRLISRIASPLNSMLPNDICLRGFPVVLSTLCIVILLV